MASLPKKYYWLKLKDDFFQSKEIKKLRKIAGGDTYVIIYLKLQLLSIKNGGKILFEKVEENFIEEMALTLDEEEDSIKFTLAFLEKCNLIECVNVDEYILPKVFDLIGSETDAAERMRRSRENKALNKESVTSLQDGYTTVTDELQTVTQREERREKKKEKDIIIREDNKNILVCVDEKIPYAEIIDYLNIKTKSTYKHTTPKTRDMIKTRFKEGFNLNDFKKCIDNQTILWLKDPKMNKYLRPDTLFSNKFESYVNNKVGLSDMGLISQATEKNMTVLESWAKKKEQEEKDNEK